MNNKHFLPPVFAGTCPVYQVITVCVGAELIKHLNTAAQLVFLTKNGNFRPFLCNLTAQVSSLPAYNQYGVLRIADIIFQMMQDPPASAIPEPAIIIMGVCL